MGFITNYQEESSNGIRENSLISKHFTDRKLFIVGEINDNMANEFVSQMLYLAKDSEPVDIYINSCGGSVNAGLVIYDIIQECKMKFPINMYCVGMAASMAAVIFAGGTKGRRIVLPHSKVMIHEPLISGGIGGSATAISNTSKSIQNTKKLINAILAEHTGKTIQVINKATSFDNYMDAKEAVKFGLCDSIGSIFQS